MTNLKNCRVAIYPYALERLDSWASFAIKMEAIVKQAAEQQANLLLLPEYAGLQLCSWLTQADSAEQFCLLQNYLSEYIELFQRLARQYSMYIQPGTLPVKSSQSLYTNRAYFFSPQTHYGFQDKLQLTQFEKNSGLIVAGYIQQIFLTPFGKVGINVCYDSEFPALTQRLVSAGVNLLLVPSCTDTMAGFHRVHFSCRARALENQIFVLQAPLLGHFNYSDFIDENVGYPGIFGPIDIGFPSDGVIQQGELNTAKLIFADLNFAKLERVRRQGQVRNWQDSHQLAEQMDKIQLNEADFLAATY